MNSVPPIPLLALTAALALLAGCSSDRQTSAVPAPLVRLDANGAAYRGSGDFAAQPWACVRDEGTGLVWEVKTPDEGLHGQDNTYSWYEPDERLHKGDAGREDGGRCTGSRCDTHALVQAVNAAGWCGFHDWRVPDQAEIASINDRTRRFPGPTVDPAYFPSLHAGLYWTRDSHLYYPGAWAWNFEYGHNQVDWKTSAKHVVLVRGEAKSRLERPED